MAVGIVPISFTLNSIQKSISNIYWAFLSTIKLEKFEIQVRKIHEQRQFKSLTLDSLTNIENEEEKKIEESKVEKSFASKGVDRLKMHETVTNNVITSHPNNPFPVTPGLVYHAYPCFSPPTASRLMIVNNEKAFGMKCYRYENVIGVYVVAIKKKILGQQIFVHYGYAD
ncbi:2484_t:CDS:2, partial [Gigaspora margarita]